MKGLTVIVLSLLISTSRSSQVVLTPSSSEQEHSVDHQEYTHITQGEENNLVVGDHLICNPDECYPKVFEPSNEWKPIKPAQLLPAGLEIRMSLEKGTKEAKLAGSQRNADQIDLQIVDYKELEEPLNESSHSETATSELSAGSSTAEIENNIVSLKGSKNRALSYKENHEFSKDFARLRSLTELSELKEWHQVVSLLDDLVEFSHDYKKGFKIVSNEFDLLHSLAFNSSSPPEVRELSARIIISCLRNNPPSIDFINENYPITASEICDQLAELHGSNGPKLLTKRFLSMLDVLLSRAQLINLNDELLWKIYNNEEPAMKLKILEIISKFYSKSNESVLDNLKQNMKIVQKWANELSAIIRTPELDEFHLRTFFHCIAFIKTKYKHRVKVDSDFLNWLIEEIEKRSLKANDDVYKRDVDQIEFDSLLTQSRHTVFGNPNAARLKERMYQDDSNLVADEL